MLVIKRIALALLVGLLASTGANAVSAPVIVPATPSQVKELTIDEKIIKYANQYGVNPKLMLGISMCESSLNRFALNDNPGVEYSVGIVQINLLAHTKITKEQAQDVDFSLEFLAKHIASGEAASMWYNCYKKTNTQ